MLTYPITMLEDSALRGEMWRARTQASGMQVSDTITMSVLCPPGDPILLQVAAFSSLTATATITENASVSGGAIIPVTSANRRNPAVADAVVRQGVTIDVAGDILLDTKIGVEGAHKVDPEGGSGETVYLLDPGVTYSMELTAEVADTTAWIALTFWRLATVDYEDRRKYRR